MERIIDLSLEIIDHATKLPARRPDRHELQTLRKQLRPFEDATLWGLIVQVMLLDTEKHATILGFLERHARRDRTSK